MIQEKIRTIIEKAVLEKEIHFSLEKPTVGNHGDYSSNVALVLAKKLNKNPLEVANVIKEKIGGNIFFKKVEVAGPGFINFFIKDIEFINELKKIKKDFGNNKNLKGRIMVEHTQPNPFKEFHIGHLMNNAIGESVARLMKVNGANIKTASYHGDIGLHVAKALWALLRGIPSKEAYAFGSKAFETNEENKKEILDINIKIYKKSDEKINALYKKERKKSFDYFKGMYKKFDSQFDYTFYESQAGEVGKKIVLENMGKIFEKGDGGAVIFKGEDVEPKTHTRVFLNSDGLPTYEAKELGLAHLKEKKWKFNQSFSITANEQDSFFKVVEVAIGLVLPQLQGKLNHISHGILKLPSGKMSSRTGQVITAESLIDNVKESIKTKIGKQGITDKDIEKIAIGAIKYSILKQAIGLDIIYDFDKSISFEGDSGPYVQYALLRALSVLEKAQQEHMKSSLKVLPETIGQLEKLMILFPDVVKKAGQKHQPHQIVGYLTALAGEFNSFYANNRIINKKDTLTRYKIALVERFSIIMQNGLWILAIPVPEKM